MSVVVDVGVVSGGRGQDGSIARAAVLDEDVGAFLAFRLQGVGQRRQTACVAAVDVHTVLKQREKSIQVLKFELDMKTRAKSVPR